MRKTFTVFAVLLLLLMLTSWVSAQVLTTENFNYTAGDSLTSHGWSAHSGAGTNVEVVTTGLTYSGYLGSNIGGSSTLATTGQDVNKTWASYPNGVTSGDIYYSLLVNLDSAQTAGDYFFHFFKNSSTFPARLFAKKAFNSNNFSLGILKGSTAANIAWSDSIYSFGTTYLVIVKYSFIPGATNDSVAMWINPNISGTEPAPTVLETVADKATADYDTVYGIAIRQGSATNAPRGKVDGIRAAQSWRSLTNLLAVLNKNSINFSNITLGTSVKDSVVVSNNDATAINVTSVTSGNSVFVVTPTSATINAGGSQKFFVTYTPTATVTSSSAIVFTSNAASSPDSVHVSGNAIQPGFGISTKTYSFGNVYKDSTVVDSVTVTNLLSASTLSVDSVKSTNPLFTVGPASASLGVGLSTKFGVSFSPTAAGVVSASIVFYNNGGLGSDTLKVTGNGIIKAPAFLATPLTFDMKAVFVSQVKKDSITVKNTGYDSLKITAVTSSDPTFTITPTSAKLDSQATVKFYITFTPTAAGSKSTSVVFTSNVTEVHDTVTAHGKGITVVPISEARKDANGDLIADHSLTGDTLAITGIVISPNMQSLNSQTAIFIQDTSGGMEIFAFALPPTTFTIGDSVLVIGTVSQYHGLDEFEPVTVDTLHFGVLKHGAAIPKPKHLTAAQFLATAESYEGQLIEMDTLYKVSGTWPIVPTNASIYLRDMSSKDTVQLFISASSNVGGSVERQYPIHVIGMVSQFSSATTVYNNGYEIEPRDSNDVTSAKIAPLVKISEARKDANSDLIPDHSVTGDTLMITGVITSPNLSTTTTTFFIQDSTGGIEVFHTGLPPITYAMGDSVFAVGKVAQFHGLDEFSPLVLDTLHFGIFKHHAVAPKAKHVTLHQYVTNAETYEGQLIEIDTLFKASGTWGSGADVYVMNATKADTTALFINAATTVASSSEPSYPINVVAIASQFASTGVSGGYEIVPRDTSDIKHITVTSVKDPFSDIPTTFVLENNYPNPFNPSTTILYGVASQSHVTVTIYSVLGQQVATLVNDVQNPSYYRVVWNGKDYNGNLVSSGVYFFRIVAEPTDGKTQLFTQVKKMMLMK